MERKVRIKVDGYLHRVLKRIDVLLGGGSPIPITPKIIDAQPIKAYIRGSYASAKDIQKCLEYGLIGRSERTKIYHLTIDGMRVLKELEGLQHANIKVAKSWEGNKIWPEEDIVQQCYEKSGYRVLTVTVPGSEYWEQYFSTRVW